jgi:hypothetical protein
MELPDLINKSDWKRGTSTGWNRSFKEILATKN